MNFIKSKRVDYVSALARLDSCMLISHAGWWTMNVLKTSSAFSSVVSKQFMQSWIIFNIMFYFSVVDQQYERIDIQYVSRRLSLGITSEQHHLHSGQIEGLEPLNKHDTTHLKFRIWQSVVLMRHQILKTKLQRKYILHHQLIFIIHNRFYNNIQIFIPWCVLASSRGSLLLFISWLIPNLISLQVFTRLHVSLPVVLSMIRAWLHLYVCHRAVD